MPRTLRSCAAITTITTTARWYLGHQRRKKWNEKFTGHGSEPNNKPSRWKRTIAAAAATISAIVTAIAIIIVVILMGNRTFGKHCAGLRRGV